MGESPSNSDKRFPAGNDYLHAYEELAKFIERLFVPSKQSASTLQALARVLLYVRRLPLTTLGVQGGLHVGIRYDSGDCGYYGVSLGEDEFELMDGGAVYDPAVGHDSYSDIRFYMQTGGYVKGSEDEILEWIEGASELFNMGGTVSVEAINDYDDTDWTELSSEQRWEMSEEE